MRTSILPGRDARARRGRRRARRPADVGAPDVGGGAADAAWAGEPRGPRTAAALPPARARVPRGAALGRDVGTGGGARRSTERSADTPQARDWRIAASTTTAMAGDRAQVRPDVIDAAAQDIIGQGRVPHSPRPYLPDLSADGIASASFEVLLSRRDFKQGDVRQRVSSAPSAAVELGRDRPRVALANLALLNLTTGSLRPRSRTLLAAASLTTTTSSERCARSAECSDASLDGSLDGDRGDCHRPPRDLLAKRATRSPAIPTSRASASSRTSQNRLRARGRDPSAC